MFEGVDAAAVRADRAAELAALPLGERLQRRIVDGEAKGLDADLDEALGTGQSALDIINDHLLAGMRTVGELFGRGEMQLPFVLQSAEVMKAAVAHLEPHIDRTDDSGGKGTIVLATVKGDVHDIGKNLVDIILSNNGYDVVNIGIKQPISEILRAAQEHEADVIGMSGLLVKSTVVMKENLEEMNSRGLAAQWPVILGGAALTRAYVENDLAEVYTGEVRYARDAFEGLRLMDALVAVRRGVPGAQLPELRPRRVRQRDGARVALSASGTAWGRARCARTSPGGCRCRCRPSWVTASSRACNWPSTRATWTSGPRSSGSGGCGGPRRQGPELRGARRDRGPAAAARVARAGADRGTARGRSRLRLLPVRVRGRRPRRPAPRTAPSGTASPSPASAGTGGCAWPTSSAPGGGRAAGGPDVVAFQLVTMGPQIARATAELFEKNAYRDYLELHGLSVQLTEALAEYWHARVREDLGLAGDDDPDLAGILRQGYRGSRYSFGYPACPDLEDRAKLVALLKPERIGVELSEELQLHPEQSTDALVVHHPEAKYFNAT